MKNKLYKLFAICSFLWVFGVTVMSILKIGLSFHEAYGMNLRLVEFIFGGAGSVIGFYISRATARGFNLE